MLSTNCLVERNYSSKCLGVWSSVISITTIFTCCKEQLHSISYQQNCLKVYLSQLRQAFTLKQYNYLLHHGILSIHKKGTYFANEPRFEHKSPMVTTINKHISFFNQSWTKKTNLKRITMPQLLQPANQSLTYIYSPGRRQFPKLLLVQNVRVFPPIQT